MNPVIIADKVTKRFHLAAGSRSIKQIFVDRLRRREPRLFTALDEVSFSVSRGETLGIIGANGAGKSTLLSIIAGTMFPTSGKVHTSGVISSLLELGAGFHPDLTGRENVFLYGAIMGIPRETMRERFDAIVEFAGLAEFIDQPVRFYSSGMYVRLGFAVAVQVDPDILLIDEVLAVGDADFQQRCLEKMAEFRNLGKSMLIISHDMRTIRSVADRILHLDHGEIRGLGAPDELVSRYQKQALGERTTVQKREWGTGEAAITAANIVDENGRPAENLAADKKLRLRIAYRAEGAIEEPVFGLSISDSKGTLAFGTNTDLCGLPIEKIEGEGEIKAEVDVSSLHSGKYFLSFALHSRDHDRQYHRLDNTLPFELEHPCHYDGIAALPCRWEVRP